MKRKIEYPNCIKSEYRIKNEMRFNNTIVLLNMKCDKCDNTAYTVLDLQCDRCDKRLCKNCATEYKCNFCKIPFCACHGVMCPNDYKEWMHTFHDSIRYRLQESEDSNELRGAIDDDSKFINLLYWLIPVQRFRCTSESASDQVVKRGRLTLDLAKYLASKIKATLDYENSFKNEPRSNDVIDIGNEEIHRETDRLWKWFIESMDYYTTIEEAREIASLIKDVDTSQFWYA
jgi:hypothetical protein